MEKETPSSWASIIEIMDDLFTFIVLIMFRIDDIYYVAIIAELHIITINLSVKQTCTNYVTVHYLFIHNI